MGNESPVCSDCIMITIVYYQHLHGFGFAPHNMFVKLCSQSIVMQGPGRVATHTDIPGTSTQPGVQHFRNIALYLTSLLAM